MFELIVSGLIILFILSLLFYNYKKPEKITPIPFSGLV